MVLYLERIFLYVLTLYKTKYTAISVCTFCVLINKIEMDINGPGISFGRMSISSGAKNHVNLKTSQMTLIHIADLSELALKKS